MTKTNVFIRFQLSSVDGGKRCENANVDVNTFMRFRETENGGFRKRISVDSALVSFLIWVGNFGKYFFFVCVSVWLDLSRDFVGYSKQPEDSW